VDALGDMEIAQKIIQTSTPTDDAGNPINEMDARFRSLKLTSMEPVDQQSKEFGELDDYTQKTHGSTHSHYKVNIKHAFRIERYVLSHLSYARRLLLNTL
jgi:poly [ADP-ribose] polymerase